MKYSSIALLTGGLLATTPANALSAATAPGFWDDPVNHPLMPLYALSLFAAIVAMLVVVVCISLLRVLNVLINLSEKERAEKHGIAYVPRGSFWQQFVQKANASVPLTQEQDIDMGHDFDGIRELDNHLPPWWKWLFAGTAVWAVAYLVVYHLYGNLPLQQEEYDQEVAVANEVARQRKAAQPVEEIDVNALKYIADAAILEKGKGVFANNNCGSCHRADGGGNTIGPNLTDAYWLHGGGIQNIFNTIKTGVVEKGMPAWGKTLSPQDVRDVTFYVMSLQGSNPADGKAPQGDLFEETHAAPDSTAVQASL
ncbi:cbb3-type cytochrome c oxidase N-terminal domain-containing protein [Dawidia soli]|uniref:C-type cytochrome n=1 Tax=Dawidia soli TaxID=2782352 RepID=A0AAP2DGQ6_9BACT|nr:cbb3-type cytochrome c oxidase N-terminal domain-containing protein [Dawidia soli]MBT1689067.1 c-type cytochrome [Dawidia soli]